MESNNSTNNSGIAEKMKFFRKLRNMTQDELAQASGINAGLIRKYEACFRKPKFEQIQLIAFALGINPTLFYDTELNTVGDAMSLIMQLNDQTRLFIDGDKDEKGNYIPSSMKFSFKDAGLNKALAQYAAYEALRRKRTDGDYTVEKENEMRLLMDQTQLKKPKG